MTNYIAEIRMFPNNERIPSGWVPCDGRVLNINSYKELYSVLKNYYGGNGTTTFAIPNLMGRVPIGMGQAFDGMHQLGEPGGNTAVSLNLTHIPPHNHLIQTVGAEGTEGKITGNLLAQPKDPASGAKKVYTLDPGELVEMDKQAIGMSGLNTPVPTVQPVLGVVYAMAMAGIYPSHG